MVSPKNRTVTVVRTAAACSLVVGFASAGFAQSPVITTFAGSLVPGPGIRATAYGIGSANSVLTDGSGGFYFSSLNRISHATSDGTLHWIAGNADGRADYSGDNGPAIDAHLTGPAGLAIDGTGNLYIADSSNHRIRKVSPDGVITTVAGTGESGYGGEDGRAIDARLQSPTGIAVDGDGNLYIADGGNDRIRKVSPDGLIQTVAGKGISGNTGDGGLATEARLIGVSDVALGKAGTLYIAEHYRIRRVTPDGRIDTVAGNGTSPSNPPNNGDGGRATSDILDDPLRIALDSKGNLYISDSSKARVRKVNTDGIISTIAGDGTQAYGGDGNLALNSQFHFPAGLATDDAGNLYIADSFNSRIRKLDNNGIITTVAGNGSVSFSGDGMSAREAQLAGPSAIAVDLRGNVYISDQYNRRIRKVDVNGVISTVAGSDTLLSLGDGGPATNARLLKPSGIAVDATGNL